MTDKSIDELKSIASQVRRDVVRMVHNVGNGHPGGAMGCADLFTLLYFKWMDHNKNFNMDGKDEDLFFLSNGHICAGWYSVLARCGYFQLDELKTHRKIDSRLQGHPTPHEGLEGIRAASGSLGQGLSIAIGAALTKKLNNDKKLVYCCMGDGEQQEGQIWEAVMFAKHHQVDNLIAFIDFNGQQIDGPTTEIMDTHSLAEKYEAFGWEVMECDGNNMEELDQCIKTAREHYDNKKPKVIVMKTEMGYPVDFMMGSHKWHGVAPDDEQKEKALAQLEETLGDFPL